MLSKSHQSFDLIAVFLTVGLFYLSFPSGGFGYFAWIAIAPVLTRINHQKCTPYYAFKIAWLTATLGWMASIWWIVIGLSQVANSSINITLLMVFIFCMIAALPYAFGAWLHVRLSLGRTILGVIQSSIIFTVLVCLLPQILPGNLAHALYLQTEHIQLAAIGGVPLVYFIVHLVNSLVALSTTHHQIRTKILASIAAISLMVGNYTYGQQTMKEIRQLERVDLVSPPLNLLLVQPNYSVTLRTREDWTKHRQSLTRLVGKDSTLADLIILPEIPMPISYLDFQDDQQFINQLVENSALLLAATEYDHQQKEIYYNSVQLIDNGKFISSYYKQFLLPFGEYLPFEKNLPWLRQLLPDTPNYQRGDQMKLFTLARRPDVKIIPLICYEAIFTQYARQGIELGGNLIINVVNDAWFRSDAGKKVHFALALFRAVEFRTMLVRVTNNGISGIIKPDGSLLTNSLLTTNKAIAKNIELRIVQQQSFYQRYPNVVKYFFSVMFMVILFLAKYGSRKQMNQLNI